MVCGCTPLGRRKISAVSARGGPGFRETKLAADGEATARRPFSGRTQASARGRQARVGLQRLTHPRLRPVRLTTPLAGGEQHRKSPTAARLSPSAMEASLVAHCSGRQHEPARAGAPQDLRRLAQAQMTSRVGLSPRTSTPRSRGPHGGTLFPTLSAGKGAPHRERRALAAARNGAFADRRAAKVAEP